MGSKSSHVNDVVKDIVVNINPFSPVGVGVVSLTVGVSG